MCGGEGELRDSEFRPIFLDTLIDFVMLAVRFFCFEMSLFRVFWTPGNVLRFAKCIVD